MVWGFHTYATIQKNRHREVEVCFEEDGSVTFEIEELGYGGTRIGLWLDAEQVERISRVAAAFRALAEKEGE